MAKWPKTGGLYRLDYLQGTTGLRALELVKAKPAGPELAANQSGEAELMPFPVLAACGHRWPFAPKVHSRSAQPLRWLPRSSPVGVQEARTSSSAVVGRSAMAPKLSEVTRVTVPLGEWY